MVTSIEPAGKLKTLEPPWFRRQICRSPPERWMLKACELRGSVLPNSFGLVFDLLVLYSVRHRIDEASLDRAAESLGVLALSDRSLIEFFATLSIFDATVSIFSLATVQNESSCEYSDLVSTLWATVFQNDLGRMRLYGPCPLLA